MIHHLREYFHKKGISAFLCTDPKNVFFLTGFRGSFGQVFITKEKVYLITDFRYTIRAKKELKNKKGLPKVEIIDVIQAKEILDKYPVIHFESAHITVDRLKTFRKIYKHTKWKAKKGLIEKFRIIKQEDEILYIKRAASIGDKVFHALKSNIQYGMKEIDLVWKIKTLIKDFGGDDVSFPPIVAFGKNSAMPHHESGQRKLRKGDMILIDFGVKYKGYASDMTRMIFTAQPKVKEKKMYNVVLEAQLSALESVKAGMKISELDKLARQYIEEHGFKGKFGHALGHGVGIDIHEEPGVSFSTKGRLKEGMVITIEPGVYIEGVGGVRIEDLVVVREGKCEILTKSSKRMLVIEVNSA